MSHSTDFSTIHLSASPLDRNPFICCSSPVGHETRTHHSAPSFISRGTIDGGAISFFMYPIWHDWASHSTPVNPATIKLAHYQTDLLAARIGASMKLGLASPGRCLHMAPEEYCRASRCVGQETPVWGPPKRRPSRRMFDGDHASPSRIRRVIYFDLVVAPPQLQP